MSRRALLVGTGVVLVACSSEVSVQDSPPPEQSDIAPTQQTELALIALYSAVRAAFPALDEPLRAIQVQHEAHLAALDGQLRQIEPPPIASTEAGALEQCALAETQAANAHQRACVTADSDLARLLTLITASEASHVPALRKLA